MLLFLFKRKTFLRRRLQVVIIALSKIPYVISMRHMLDLLFRKTNEGGNTGMGEK